MTLFAAVGQARALDGREAGLQAAHDALNQLGNLNPTLGIVISSYRYDGQQVISGVSSLTGSVPLIGLSTSGCLTSQGMNPHAVVVAFLASADVRADVQWFPGYAQTSREVIQLLADAFARRPHQVNLLFADGFNADLEQFCNAMPPGCRLIGGVSSGDLYLGNAYQIAGAQCGSGGLALARLEGRLAIGVGYDHGWQPVGAHFRVTRSRGFWVRTLDGRPASEAYAHLFGYPAREWAFPPLNQLVRLYPLGIEQEDKSLLLRSPLRIEADGSFRMNTTIRDGAEAYLLVGGLSTCASAAQRAVQQALTNLEGARPVLALVLVDYAWQLLYKAQPGADLLAVQEALGENIPIAGCYTLGQVVPVEAQPPKFLNQHMLVVLFGAS